MCDGEAVAGATGGLDREGPREGAVVSSVASLRRVRRSASPESSSRPPVPSPPRVPSALSGLLLGPPAPGALCRVPSPRLSRACPGAPSDSALAVALRWASNWRPAMWFLQTSTRAAVHSSCALRMGPGTPASKKTHSTRADAMRGAYSRPRSVAVIALPEYGTSRLVAS